VLRTPIRIFDHDWHFDLLAKFIIASGAENRSTVSEINVGRRWEVKIDGEKMKKAAREICKSDVLHMLSTSSKSIAAIGFFIDGEREREREVDFKTNLTFISLKVNLDCLNINITISNINSNDLIKININNLINININNLLKLQFYM